MIRIVSLTLPVFLFAACGPDISPPVAETSSGVQSSGLVVYPRGVAVPDCELVDLGPPEGLGGTVLSGSPRISARVDHSDGPLTAGVFQATRGDVLIHFPFTEHATILVGSVRLTDPTGQTAVLEPGDSYVIGQGTDILWQVSGARVQKSFFNRVEAADAPGPMRIHRRGQPTPAQELVVLGPPEALGGVTVAGTPLIAERADLSSPTLSAGILDVTRGQLSIDFPFTAHAAVTDGRLDLIDDLGRAHALRAGDAYLVTAGTPIGWGVQGQRVQQSFMHLALQAP